MAGTLTQSPAADPSARAAHRATAAERWIAVLRIVMGFWFAKGVITKLAINLLGGFLPVPTASARWHAVMPKLLKGYAASTPLAWYHDFVIGFVLPHASLFAQLTAFGEAAVGVGLLLGLLTPVAAAIGVLLVLNYGVATLGAGPTNPGFHLMLLTGMLAVLGSGAGRVWGLDGWLLRRRQRR
jgi:uncharacterized membrane protein YphA (DoxX/SURF4 family)